MSNVVLCLLRELGKGEVWLMTFLHKVVIESLIVIFMFNCLDTYTSSWKMWLMISALLAEAWLSKS